MSYRNITVEIEPEVEPVSLSEVYDWLRLDPEGSPASHPHDTMLTMLLVAARKHVESVTKRKLVQQTLKMTMDKFPSSAKYLELMYPPLIEVLSVEYYDENNDLQTWASSKWFVSDALPPVLNCADGEVWPCTFSRPDAVSITYVVGYAPLGSSDLIANVPEAIKQAILVHVQLGYDELSVDKRNAFMTLVNNLLAPYTVHTV